MSCLTALSSQILTFVSVPHEILSLRHKVLREYAKVLLGPDFSHTFPSFILITAVCVALKRSLSFRWLPIATNKTFLQAVLQAAFSWVIINAALWYWLIIQRILYCTVCNYWDDEDKNDNPIWWKKVWASYDPLSPEPKLLSASFISWILSMILATIFYLLVVHVNYITHVLAKIFFCLWDNLMQLITMRTFRQKISKRNEEIEDVLTDKSEAGSYCDECKSEVSTDYENYMHQRKITPISNGTNWQSRPFAEKKREANRAIENNHRNLRSHRGCSVPSSSSEKSTAG